LVSLLCWSLQRFGVALGAVRVDSTDICNPLADLPVMGVEAVHWQDLAEDLMVELVEFLGFWEVLVDWRVEGLQLWYGDGHTSRTHPLQGGQVQAQQIVEQSTPSFRCCLHCHVMIRTCGHNWCWHGGGGSGTGGHGNDAGRGLGVLCSSCCPLSRQG
jgi:hypothetical protein